MLWSIWSSLTTLAQDAGVPDLPPDAVKVISTETHQIGLSTTQTILSAIYAVVCVALIIAVLTRTTKSEGLSGSMMGPSESVFKGKKSVEDSVDTVTNFLAVAFLILSLFIAYAAT